MRLLILALLLVVTSPALARPVLLELFTSQSCSSCPPAEALLATLQATQPGVIALEFHVDYWNALNWRDRYSSPAATNRQRAYAARLGTEMFTPQLVIDGQTSAIGSDQTSILAAVAAARHAQAPAPRLALTAAPDGVTLAIGAGQGSATLLLAGFDPSHETRIAAGENGGAVLREINVVREFRAVATWHGAALQVTTPRPAGTRLAAILQRTDGTVLSATLMSTLPALAGSPSE
jgi:hypothetical protein